MTYVFRLALMFNTDFDPLEVLEQLKNTQRELAHSHNEHADLLKQITEFLQQIGQHVNAQDLEIRSLHNRIQILETVRAYETDKITTNSPRD